MSSIKHPHVITCKAAVAWGAGEPLIMEQVEVSPPQPMEIRIKVVCTSLCRSDITAWQSHAIFPRIFGHEASGVVESVGEGVTEFQEGDHVLTVFTGECMKCRQCKSGKSNICEALGLERRGVMHSDHKTRFSINGKPIFHYCAVSSFSEYTVVHSGCAVKVSPLAPLDKICLLSCGVAAGLGAAWNVANISMEALELFSKMQEENIEPSEFTMVSLLNACARLGALKQGEWVHDYIKKNDFELNIIVITAIIDMYCKCGSIDKALQTFEATPKRGLSCWNSMIFGLAMNGCEEDAIHLFSKLQSKNLKPDYVTFLGVLTACNQSGMVDKASYYFSLMTNTYKIKPSTKHYNCMVDVLCRARLIEEAEELIRSMPVNPDAIIWGSLLSACRNSGNIEMAKRAAKHVIELDPNDSCAHLLMSNVYAASSHFEAAMEERLSMKEKHIEKEPGCSLIEVDGEVHEFVSGGRLHNRAPEIYSLLNELRRALQGME